MGLISARLFPFPDFHGRSPSWRVRSSRFWSLLSSVVSSCLLQGAPALSPSSHLSEGPLLGPDLGPGRAPLASFSFSPAWPSVPDISGFPFLLCSSQHASLLCGDSMSVMRPTGSSGAPCRGGGQQAGEHPGLAENQALRAWPRARVQGRPKLLQSPSTAPGTWKLGWVGGAPHSRPRSLWPHGGGMSPGLTDRTADGSPRSQRIPGLPAAPGGPCPGLQWRAVIQRRWTAPCSTEVSSGRQRPCSEPGSLRLRQPV